MYANSRRALMLITVFLVSIMSPFTTPIEPVEAHAGFGEEPPLRVKVYLNHLYSNDDLDDGGVGVSGWDGDAELAFMGQVDHVTHGKGMHGDEIHWNMDDDDGTGILWGNTDDRVEITRPPCWEGEVEEDSDCDGENDNIDIDDDNDGIPDESDDLNDPDGNGKEGRQELMQVYDFEPRKLLWQHDECTPAEDVKYSFGVRTISSFDWWWYTQLIGALIAIGGLTIATGGTFAVAMGATAAAISTASVIEQAWEVFVTGTEELQPRVINHELQIGYNNIFPSSEAMDINQGGPVGVNVTLEIETLPDRDEYDHYPCDDTLRSDDSEENDDGDDLGQVDEVGYQEARTSVSNGFNQLRSLYATVNESTSLANSTDLIGSDGCDEINGTGDCDDWNKTQEPVDPLNNTDPYNSTTHTVDRGIILTKLNGMVANLSSEYLTSATDVNSAATYPLTMDMWYADFLTQGGHYFDALGYYESAIIGSIDAIENAPPPPPAMVTVQAGGDDVPEDLFIEIYSGDCGDDCDEGDLVFVGDEGDSEIETALESGEYTVVMISDGDVYSSEYMEVLSGETQSLVVGVSHAPVLDTLLYVQGMLIAAIPALLGFTGSRRYIEGEHEEFEGRSATPLWIGTAIFIGIFYMIIG